MEATGFGVMHVDETDRIIAFLEKPKDPPAMPDKPDMALASMGIYVFETQLPDRPAAPRRGRPGLEPRFRQGHHPLHLVKHGKAVAHRFTAILRPLRPARPKPTGATSARSTPIGRPIST